MAYPTLEKIKAKFPIGAKVSFKGTVFGVVIGYTNSKETEIICEYVPPRDRVPNNRAQFSPLAYNFKAEK